MKVLKAAEIINDLINKKDLSAASFAKQLGYDRPQIIYDIQKGKTKRISPDLANKIISVYPDVDRNFLLTGSVREPRHPYSNPSKTQTVPLLPILAYGGSLNQFVTSLKDSDCERILSPVEGAELAITVTGESMAPKFPNGSKVFIQKINDSAFIDWGKAYVLDTCNGTVLKILVPGSSDDCVKCLSLNPDEIYAPFEVCKKDIYGVYRILMLFSLQ